MASETSTSATRPRVSTKVEDHLRRLARSDQRELDDMVGMRQGLKDVTGLDDRSFALVKLAALIAVDAPPASYAWQVANALDEGATPEDILGVLRAVATQVGGPRVVAAAPEIMVALGLDLPDEEG